MTRRRLLYDGGIYHAVTRCNNKELLFQNDYDFKKYLYFVRKYKYKFGFKLFNYALMHNHAHLLVKTMNNISLSKIMHCINWYFANWYNKTKETKQRFGEKIDFPLLI